jgi:hypothetical protein
MTTIILSVAGTCMAFLAAVVTANTYASSRGYCIACNWACGLWLGSVSAGLFVWAYRAIG